MGLPRPYQFVREGTRHLGHIHQCHIVTICNDRYISQDLTTGDPWFLITAEMQAERVYSGDNPLVELVTDLDVWYYAGEPTVAEDIDPRFRLAIFGPDQVRSSGVSLGIDSLETIKTHIAGLNFDNT